MAERKKSKKVKEEKVAAPEAGEEAIVEEAVEMVSAEEFAAVQEALAAAQSELANKQDELLRSLAEFSNFKKRIERDQAASYQVMKGEMIKRFLPVLDDLTRALQDAPEDSWVEGVQLIHRKLESILEAEGVTRIEADGAEFDPNFHEAIAQVSSDEHESGHIVEVLQQGYMLGERVIRPTLVRVAE